MSGLNQAVKAIEFDIRLREWNKRFGTLDDAQIKQHRESQPDDSANATSFTLEDDGETFTPTPEPETPVVMPDTTSQDPTGGFQH